MLETINLLSGTVYHAAGGPPRDALPAVTLPQNLTWNDNGIAGARLVRSGISMTGISGFKVVRGWKFEGSFEGTSSGSNRFYLAGLNIGERFGAPAIMSQNESSGLSLGTNVIYDEFPAVSYPLTGLALGSVTDLSWPGFVLSMWGLTGSGTKSVTIPDGYLTTAELYVSDLPMLAFLEQPLDPVAAGDSFTVRIRAYYTEDDESVVGGYFMCAPSGFSGVTVVGDSLKQTDANGEIEWTFAVAEDSPTAEGSVIIAPAPHNSDVLPGRYEPRTDMPIYGYQSDIYTTYSIAVSVEGGGVVPEGCFWDGIVNAVEECGEAPVGGNLLCTPESWEYDPENGNGAVSSPPAIWDGTAYVFDTAEGAASQPVMTSLGIGGTIEADLYIDPSSYYNEFNPYSLEIRNHEFELLESFDLVPGTSYAINVSAAGGIILQASEYFSYPMLFYITPTC